MYFDHSTSSAAEKVQIRLKLYRYGLRWNCSQSGGCAFMLWGYQNFAGYFRKTWSLKKVAQASKKEPFLGKFVFTVCGGLSVCRREGVLFIYQNTIRVGEQKKKTIHGAWLIRE